MKYKIDTGLMTVYRQQVKYFFKDIADISEFKIKMNSNKLECDSLMVHG